MQLIACATMSCEETTIDILKDTGHRLTPQRLLILSAIRHAEGHVTAAQIQDEVRETYPYVDVSTVYRNLNALRENGLITEAHIGSGDSEYEWIGQDRHHHIVCKNCESILQVDDSYLNSLSDSVMKDYGFRVDIEHLPITGLCKDCNDK